jgi:hypothetical protein
MSLTTYASNKLADHLYNNAPYTSPEIWVGLHRSNGDELVSPTDGGYARVRLDDKMAAANNGVCTTNADLTFPASTTSWGEVTKVGLWDGPTAGNLLQVIDLDAPLTISTNTIVNFPAGSISLGFAG